jgi:hypothetical protein
MQTIHAPAGGHNAVADDLIIVPYVDTVGMFFARYLPVGTRRLLEPLTRHRTIIEPAYARHHGLVNYHLTVHQPSAAVVLLLTHLQAQHRYRACICRVDVAVDWCWHDHALAKLMHQWAYEHLRLRWRRPGRRFRAVDAFSDDHTDYMISQRDRTADGKRRSARDLALYSSRSKPSKVTGLPCCHAELRFQNAAACRAQGWHLPTDLLRLNPHALANRHLRIDNLGTSFPLTALCIPRKLVWFPTLHHNNVRTTDNFQGVQTLPAPM